MAKRGTADLSTDSSKRLTQAAVAPTQAGTTTVAQVVFLEKVLGFQPGDPNDSDATNLDARLTRIERAMGLR